MKRQSIWIGKRLAALLLALTITASLCLPGGFSVLLASAEDSAVWDGSVSASLKGNGTAEAPFRIESGADLAFLANTATVESTSGKYYILTKNILLNAKTADFENGNGLNEWIYGKGLDIKVGNDTKHFAGILDGAGHTISGLYIKAPGGDGSWNCGGGLFQNLISTEEHDAVIRNLGIVQSSLRASTTVEWGQSTVGAFAGSASVEKVNGTPNAKGTVVLEGCWVGEDVTVAAATAAAHTQAMAGGFIGGGNASVKINNSSFTGSVSSTNNANAFWGGYWDAAGYTLTNCWATSTLYRGDGGGKTSANTTLKNLYGTKAQTDVTVLTADQMKGEAAKTNMPGLDWRETAGIWQVSAGGYPRPFVPENYQEPSENPDVYDQTNPGDVWSGKPAKEYAGGSGAAADPYQIATGGQLAKLVKDGGTAGKYYILTHDIRLNATGSDWTATPGALHVWFSTEDTGVAFQGTLDGNGHTISGLYYKKEDAPSDQSVGLFPKVSGGAAIKNLGIVYASLFITGTGSWNSAGSLAGQATGNVAISGCFADNTVSVHAKKGVGGFIGGGTGSKNGGNVKVTDCYFTGTVTSETDGYAAAFYGDEWDDYCLIENSYAVNVPLSRRNGTIKTNVYGTVEQENVVKLTTVQMTGTAAKTNMPGLDWETVWETADGATPRLRIFTPDGVPGTVWRGGTAQNYAGGDGSESNPWQIATGEQLAKLVKDPGTAGKYYKLTKNIRLNATGSDWTATPGAMHVWFSTEDTGVAFQGTLDGNGYTISGLYYKKEDAPSDQSVGLFPKVSGGAAIKNLGIVYASLFITGTGSWNSAGSLAGQATGNVAISGCFADNTVSVHAKKGVGGFIGGGTGSKNGGNVKVTDCYFTGTVTSETDGYAAAFYGDEWDDYCLIENSYAVNVPLSRRNGTIKTNVYGTVEQENVVKLTAAQMTGTAAKTNMSGLDFNTVWWASKNGMPQLRVFGVVDDSVWDGSTAADYAGGSGTKDDPWQIATGAQLAKLVKDTGTTGKYYVLTDDILLNNTAVDPDGWTNKSPREWLKADRAKFAGTLDGAGHTISGLYYRGTDASYNWFRGGLFEYLTEGAVIRNVGIIHADMNVAADANVYLGGLAGYTDNHVNVTITGCWADETVSIRSSHAAGGLIGGGIANAAFSNCYFTGRLTSTQADEFANAFYGDTWTSDYSILYSYTAGSTVYRTRSNRMKHVYSTQEQGGVTKLKATQMQGNAAKTNMSGLDWATVWTAADGQYPTLRPLAADYQDPNYGDGVAGQPWTGKEALDYAGGDGSRENPFLIATAEQLYKLVNESAADTRGKYYALREDILLNDTAPSNWKDTARQWRITSTYTSPSFQGTLEGGGHTIRGLYVNSEKLKETGWIAAGLFPSLGDGATIRNLHFADSELTLTGCAAAFAGLISGYAHQPNNETVCVTITGCSADDSVAVQAKRTEDPDRGPAQDVGAGGFLGGSNASVSFSNCWFTGAVSCSDESAATAFCGSSWTKGIRISSCYTVGSRTHRTGEDFLKNVYSDVAQEGVTQLTVEQMKGDAAKTYMRGLDWATVWTVAAGQYPALTVIPADYRDPSIGDGTPGAVWSGKVAPDFAQGDGTVDHPFTIATAEQLAKLLETVVGSPADTRGKYYKLTHDIRLNDTTTKNWEENAKAWYTTGAASACFQGHFDGSGHVVSGLYVNQTNSGNIYAGLFPAVWYGSSITNVGLSQSHVMAYSEKGEAYAGGIAAYVQVWQASDNVTAEQYPQLSGCFGDASVILESQFAGGILCGAPCPFVISDCYFVGTVKAMGGRAGGILGNSWTNMDGASVTNCYAATADEDSATGFGNSRISFTNTYATASSINGIASLGLNSMRGSLALERMKGFDFEKVWKALDNGTPVLRIYGSDVYTNSNQGRKVKISFITNGGDELEPIYGNEGDPIVWPTVKRYGYSFEGWYVYEELDVRFTLDTFPMFDVTLHANWTKVGIEQGFESYPYNNEDGMGSDYQYIRPGVLNYNAEDVHGGSKAIRRLGQEADEQDFVLFGSELGQLAVGQKYDLTFWVYIDDSNEPPVFKLGHTDYPDIIEPAKWYETIPLTEKLTAGEWRQVAYTFTADASYLVFRTSGAKMVLDDFHLVPTGESGIPSGRPGNTSRPSGSYPDTGVFPAAGAAAAVALSLGGLVVFRRRKR